MPKAQARLQALYAKQGRITQFTTVAARDQFLNREIKSLNNLEAQLTKTGNETAAELESTTDYVQQVQTQTEDAQTSCRERLI